jgi:hypothetical protein
MSSVNPLWGAPRIHGELFKLGIEISQATVGRYLPRRLKTPSPTWRSFLHNHVTETLAIDMQSVASVLTTLSSSMRRTSAAFCLVIFVIITGAEHICC